MAIALNDREPLVCGHAAWAHRHGGGNAGVRGREEVEEDAWMREEIGAALI